MPPLAETVGIAIGVLTRAALLNESQRRSAQANR